MAAITLGSRLYAGLLGDEEVERLFDDAAEIAAMIRVEKALAIVQGRLGLIPEAAADALVAGLDTVFIDPTDLAAGMARDGIGAPALVAALKTQLPPECADYLHYGATSQDIADLGLLLRLANFLTQIEARMDAVIRLLAGLAKAHDKTPCLARTRSQQAAPTLFGLKAANWLQPFLRHRQRLGEIRPRLLAVQLGGGAGTLAAMGPRAVDVMDALADELGLARAVPWHAARDRMEEFANLLVMIASSIGRMGADFVLLAQSEIGEIGFAGAGGSSTLPQKQNPVIAEVLVALARFAATQGGAIHQAAIHVNERDGAALTLEWLALPALAGATGAALRNAVQALETLRPDSGRMRGNLDATRGLVLSEAASFALAAHMPRAEASRIVKQAVTATVTGGGTLIDEVAARSDAPVDWVALADPGSGLEAAGVFTARILAEAEALVGPLDA